MDVFAGLREALGAKPKADPVIVITITWCPGFEHQVIAKDVTVTPVAVLYHADDTAQTVAIQLSKVDRVELEASS